MVKKRLFLLLNDHEFSHSVTWVFFFGFHEFSKSISPVIFSQHLFYNF